MEHWVAARECAQRLIGLSHSLAVVKSEIAQMARMGTGESGNWGRAPRLARRATTS